MVRDTALWVEETERFHQFAFSIFHWLRVVRDAEYPWHISTGNWRGGWPQRISWRFQSAFWYSLCEPKSTISCQVTLTLSCGQCSRRRSRWGRMRVCQVVVVKTPKGCDIQLGALLLMITRGKRRGYKYTTLWSPIMIVAANLQTLAGDVVLNILCYCGISGVLAVSQVCHDRSFT